MDAPLLKLLQTTFVCELSISLNSDLDLGGSFDLKFSA
jgi:hypothetical protein